ncbi:hypothetical protein HG66A1_54560 [Gimesia chilikensis]|uniref:Uncharacterized protein n=1 Tax=Gimesia chilikensis TaxID=2605989 RepID=A0A517PW88_9PLAN|nr:hypothetical protein HG66A1_54560 [Gimesia chilikensis]
MLTRDADGDITAVPPAHSKPAVNLPIDALGSDAASETKATDRSAQSANSRKSEPTTRRSGQ